MAGIYLCITRIQTYFILISGIFTGLSGVVCGIHYPKDIFLGYFIGVFGYFAGSALLDLLFGIAA